MTGGPERHLLVWPEHGVEMAFRLIPAGAFRMGSRGYWAREEPIHRVCIPEPFWLAETPVTQAQFAVWTRAERIEHENHFKDRPEHPAESMDWQQAVAYCGWLTRVKAAELPDGFAVACLPTEAEWEYACRAGTETEYYTGDGEAALAEAGWFGEEWDKGATHPVRQKKPNAFGLYDMHGNIWEWCRDVWDAAAYRKRADGWVATEWTLPNETRRVLRGGSWRRTARDCRAATRFGIGPAGRHRFLGFRVGLVRGPSARSGTEAAPTLRDGGRGTRPQSSGGGDAADGAPDLAAAKFPPRSG